MEWRTNAAVWGAGLSTFLALSGIIPEWPVPILEPGAPPRGVDPAWLRLRVFNPSKRPLIITSLHQITVKRGTKPIEFFYERDVRNRDEKALDEIKFAQRAFGKQLRVYIPGEVSAAIRIAAIYADTDQCLTVWWHRNWLLQRSLPMFVRISATRAQQINGA